MHVVVHVRLGEPQYQYWTLSHNLCWTHPLRLTVATLAANTGPSQVT